jgi:uncharacterized protein YjbI with pentapeptide repeats
VSEQQPSRWPPTRRQLLWAAGVAALAFLIIVICGYLFGWKWTGLPKRTLWDWLALLIVPAVLAVGGCLLTERQRALDRELSTQQAQTDRELADERRQNDTLQAYLDGMSQLLTDKERPLHMAQSGDSLRTVARARTLTVLGRLDSGRKRSILEFLFESELIYKEHILLDEGGLIERRHNIVSLRQADLRDADLYRGNLREANLGYANLSSADLSSADLRDGDLRDADLRDADLKEANLRDANLYGAVLREVDLSAREADVTPSDLSEAFLSGSEVDLSVREADLSGAFLREVDLRGASLQEAILRGADLRGADLRGAFLIETDLKEADLRDADLRDAKGATSSGVANELLSAASSLEGATMPDGQTLRGDKMSNGPTFEDWLKDGEGRKEDAQNE